MPAHPTPVIGRVQEEQGQGHSTRIKLFAELEKEIGRPVVSFYTSLNQPVIIEDDDAEIIEGILQNLDLSNGLALFISSHGGDGLAAERILTVCRNYSDTGEFWAIVPSKAKSAATMVCFGASKILMGTTSELGPIDPQITLVEDGRTKWFSLYNIVESYKDLFSRAVKESGNLQPYLQQLANYDEREIKEYKSAIALSNDIAVRALASGMMRGKTEAAIEKKIEIFLTPERTKTHGRAIYRDEAETCGLKIEKVDTKSKLWQLIYELNIRTNYFVSTRATKCIESRFEAFASTL
jgi:Serine dehydrogenase proteinase